MNNPSPTTQTMTVRGILLRAADHIVHVGLHRRDFFPLPLREDTADGPCCADAAIKLAAGISPAEILEGRSSQLAINVEELLAEHLMRLGQKECVTFDQVDLVETIGTWNDQQGMTADEVAGILRDVAELAR